MSESVLNRLVYKIIEADTPQELGLEVTAAINPATPDGGAWELVGGAFFVPLISWHYRPDDKPHSQHFGRYCQPVTCTKDDEAE